jgi:predicted CopG family antitoxin
MAATTAITQKGRRQATTVSVTVDTHTELFKLKERQSDSFDDVIRRLLNEHTERTGGDY